jgi:very-short-patch-repair endonuclease
MAKHWTPFEDRRLRELALACTAKQIGRILGRTKSAVYSRANKLGLRIGAPSELEATLAYQMKAAGLPEPHSDYRFNCERKWRFDFAFVDRKLAVECEGGTWTAGRHSRGKGYAEDCRKYNHAILLGWRVLRFTSEMITSGEALAVVEKALSVQRTEQNV